MIHKSTRKHITHYQSEHSSTSHLKTEFAIMATIVTVVTLNMYYGITALTHKLIQTADMAPLF